jgi:hypothetical protein
MTRTALLAVIGLLVATPAFADDMPTRKPGLWEMKLGGGPAGTTAIQHCTDAATDKALNASAIAAGDQDCSKRDIKKTAGGMTIDSTCTIAGRNVTSHIEVVGSFDSAYTMKISGNVAGGGSGSSSGGGQLPAGMPTQMTLTMEAKWLGPCKPDQKPGDMIMPGGMKINVQNLRAPGGLPGTR